MAATRLIPLHRGKGKTIAECLKERTDYTENKEKTEDGKYISSYACDVKTADEEFMLSRREYEQCFRSARKDEVIAYQIRQSFKPGEITPELANKIGYELAMRFTGGRHAFTVCTHTDKRHIHNHITFNSITIDGKRKFNNYSFSAMTVRKISDMLCLENGLSVIKPVRADRNEASRNLMSLVDIEKAMLAGKGPGYERWAKVFNVKQMAKSLLFLQEHGIKDYGELKTRIQKIKQDISDTREEIDRCEEKLTANKELQTHIINYSKSGGTDEAARKAFRKFKYGQLPKMKQLRKEHEDLWQQKKNSYSRYSGAKKELKEYLIAKKNLDLIMESGEAAGSQATGCVGKIGFVRQTHCLPGGIIRRIHMKIEVRTKEFDNAINGLKGSATLSFDSCFAVQNLSIVENKEGSLFVSMPSYKTKQVDENGKDIYKDICFPVTKEFRGRLVNAVLTSFKEHKPVMIDTAKGRDSVLTDSVRAALEDTGELPFDKGESVNAGSPDMKNSIKDDLADKVKESKTATKVSDTKKKIKEVER